MARRKWHPYVPEPLPLFGGTDMQPEEMRTLIVGDIDKILSAGWIVQQMISADQKRLLHATRDYFQQADTAALQSLIDLYNRQPQP